MDTRRMQKYYRFILYLAVVVLVNIAGMTMFFRVDLTSSGIYSLSKASEEAVATLSEPLTINVFFTKDLPAPHNNTERYLRDLLEEYSAHSNKYFNYRFYDVSAEEGDIGEEARKNQELARSYGIYPVQVQNIEQDEVEFKRAYMGLVMIYGDVVDKIPSITTTEGLEYTITSKLEKMNSKISVLMNLEEPVKVKLFLSSSLQDIAARLRLGDISAIPGRLESIVDDLNDKYYGKLEFESVDPAADGSSDSEISRYGVLTLRWPSPGDASGAAENRGTAGLVVENGGKHVTIPLIEVVRVPLFGTQYQLADIGAMGERLSETIDDVLDVNKKIGYLSTHGALPLAGAPQMPGQPQQQESLSNLNSLLSDQYSVENVDPAGGIPDGIDCLIIAGPTQEFSDWELFQIDQFLMKGKSIAFFLDPFEEIQIPQGQQQMNYNQGPIYRPLNTGLEKLLGHYGVDLPKAYVLDENCFEQRLPQMYGGGTQAIYFAPVIKAENINSRLPFLGNIKALISILSSPVDLKSDRLAEAGLEGGTLFSSSARSWEMSGRINLNPMFLRPPDDSSEMGSYDLAAIVSGEFPSWFAGRDIPEKPADEADSTAVDSSLAPAQEDIQGEGGIVTRGAPGSIVVVGSAAMLKDNVLDESGGSTNATFVMNVIDHLNGRDQYAEMRSKMQRYNPLRETSGAVKTFVKSFNIAGLPVLIALLGIMVWVRRRARKRRIEMMFSR